jgi:hypothetical protein
MAIILHLSLELFAKCDILPKPLLKAELYG